MTESLTMKEVGADIAVHGYFLLLKAIKFPETTKSGLTIPESYRKIESKVHNIGLVLDMGPMAYKPLEKYNGTPYCSIGDWVIYSHYERVELTLVNGNLCYLIADDRVLGTIKDIKDVVKDLDMWGAN